MIGALIVSLILNGYLIARDITHGLIAGAIAVGAGSLYIMSPAFPLISGFMGGSLQTVFQNSIEKKALKKGFLISTVSWTLFGVQGFIGGFFAVCWKNVAINSWNNNFNANILHNFGEQNELYIMLISMGFGLAFGILAGLIIWCTNVQGRNEYFDDGFYWRNFDGIHVYEKKHHHHHHNRQSNTPPHSEKPLKAEKEEEPPQRLTV